MNVAYPPRFERYIAHSGGVSHTTLSTPQVLLSRMDFASPVASRIAGEPTDSFSTGKTFATRTFNTAKNPFAAKRQSSDSTAVPATGIGMETVVRHREERHPPASGEGLRP